MSGYTIGEVLNQLKDEFDDVTISKIRFLEAEGLISPDRTESGYRKFDDADVDRLRYILRAQRDRYLPLKVIREELERLDAGEPVEGADDAGAPPEAGAAAPSPVADALSGPPAEVRLTIAELADATGLETAQLRALRDHGLLHGTDRFDADDLRVAELAAALLQTGLEARHLRMYRQFADREVALFEQLIAPLLRQRNPDSRRAATERLDEVVDVGSRLHHALLARELRALLRS